MAVPTSILPNKLFQSRTNLTFRFMEAVLDRLKIPPTDSFILISFDCDTWMFRTEGER